MNSIFSYFVSRYLYDVKKLSIGRILIGTIILVDVIFRYQNLDAHYTNDGVLPTTIIKMYYPAYQYYISFHNLIGDHTTLIQLLFFIHFVLAIALLVGFYTKYVTILNFIFLLSLHHRNPVILQGGDDLLRITLFYMMFLPWGKYCSVDFLICKKKHPVLSTSADFSWIYVVFLINIAFVYLFSALLKTAPEWRYTGDAIYYALSLDTLRTPIGNILYNHPYAMKIATFMVYYILEVFIPLLLIFPLTINIRKMAVVSILLLHIFILLHLKVGIFPFVGITTALMLLPPKRNLPSENYSLKKHDMILSIILFTLVLRYNCATLNHPFFSMTLYEDRFINAVGLAQRWNMFSPGVKRYDGWLILRGIKANHQEWDIIHDTPVLHYEKTPYNTSFLEGDRWRKFLENYEQTQYNFIKPYFCRYLMKQWNSQHPDNPIEALNILFVKKETLPHYHYKTNVENLALCSVSDK